MKLIGKAGWLQARHMANEFCGLPSNVLLERIIDQEGFKSPVWAREILVYPKVNGQFSGKDIVDGRFIFPGSCVPEDALGRKRMGLFVDPGDVEVKGDSVIIHPSKIIVLGSFIQDSDDLGRIDGNTGIAVKEEKVAFNPRFTKTGLLYRIKGEGVRPIVRGCNKTELVEDIFHSTSYANCSPDSEFGVMALE